MSLKQWAQAPRPSTQDVKKLWADAGLDRNKKDEDEIAHVVALDIAANVDETSQRSKNIRRYKSASGKGLDGSIWLAWEEMEGDTDGSGDIAMCTGDLEADRTRIDPLGKFIPEPAEGKVLKKLSPNPIWATGFGQNIGPSVSGHCLWNMTVLRRDGNMYIGLVVPHAVMGELDRRWDTKNWQSQAFFWATTAGTIMNGPDIKKTLPTTIVQVCHFNVDDVVTLDLKVDRRELIAKVIKIDDHDYDFTNRRMVKFRIQGLSTGDMYEDLPPLYCNHRVYFPEDYDMLDQTFVLSMMDEHAINDELDFRFTGTLTFLLNGKKVGMLKGVPHDAAPAVCFSQKGDMVQLDGSWSDRDQDIINKVRDSLIQMFRANKRPQLQIMAADKEDGLTDWIILKCIRANNYEAEEAVEDLIDFCELHAADAVAKKKAKLNKEKQAHALTAYQEDTTVSDRFTMKDRGSQASMWNPKTVNEAMEWQPLQEGMK